MEQFSRRSIITATGTVALAVAAIPLASLAGLLDRWFGHPAGRITPPITSNEDFYLTSYRSPPTIRVADWSLAIDGLVERPITMSYDQLVDRPTVSQIVTLECVGNLVGGESISTAVWEGVPLRDLLQEAGLRPETYDIVFRAADGFSDSIRVERAMEGDVLIAHRMNGVVLPQGHGFPARAIVPGHYGMKHVQWLTRIEAVEYDYKGYYAQKGWTDEAVVKTMSRIDAPGHGSTLKGFNQKVQGLAFAGTRGIQQVDISTDGGESWNVARLDAPLSSASWVFWSYDWAVPMAGRHTLMVRATDRTGRLQTSMEQDAAPDGASGLQEVTVTVEPSPASIRP